MQVEAVYERMQKSGKPTRIETLVEVAAREAERELHGGAVRARPGGLLGCQHENTRAGRTQREECGNMQCEPDQNCMEAVRRDGREALPFPGEAAQRVDAPPTVPCAVTYVSMT